MYLFLFFFSLLVIVYPLSEEQSEANNDVEYSFRRDFLDRAYRNWIHTSGARFSSVADDRVTPIGRVQLHRYDTNRGEVFLRVHLDAYGGVYDIGLALPDDPGLLRPELQTIVERFLWALQLSDLNVQRTFFNSPTIRLDFGVLGGLDEQLRAYHQLALPAFEGIIMDQKNQSCTIRIPVRNRELSVTFEPSLTLLLNDQVDVVSDYLFESLSHGSPDLPVQFTGPDAIHQPEFSGEELSFISLNQHMAQKKVVKAINIQNEIDFRPDTEEALQESRFVHWSSWPYWKHIPGYVDQLKPTNVRLVLEGIDLHELSSVDAVKIAHLATFLSEDMVVLTDTEVPRRNRDGKYSVTTYVVFHHQGLSFQHMVRIREIFVLTDQGFEEYTSEVHVLLTVRLDNVRNLYAQHFGASVSETIRIHIRQ